MNNNFYFDYGNNTKNKYSSNKTNLLLAFIGVALLIIGYILMTNGMFDKVSKVETTTERKIVYLGESETIKVKVKTNGSFSPSVKFKSKKDKFTLSDDIQYGEEVKTKIKGSKAGEDVLVIDAGKGGTKDQTVKIDVLVCEKPEIKNTGDKVINIKEGSSTLLKFNVDGECLKGYDIEVENEKIATIDNDYNLKAKKVGTTTLVLKRGSDTIRYKINVKSLTVAVKSVRINTKSFNLAVGKTKKLSVTVSPNDAGNREVKYTSSNERVATVSSNGTVKGVGIGKVTITVISVSDSSKKSSISIKVYKQTATKPATTTTTKPTTSPKIVHVTGIKFESNSYSISYNETKKLTLGVTPTNSSNKSITCKSLNTGIVTASARAMFVR